ncbi:MAG: hypothetical protein JWN08_1920, partial [Frankiales bacterium]|nr:hypothetical protein [Frankiales bacterium]
MSVTRVRPALLLLLLLLTACGGDADRTAPVVASTRPSAPP